MNLKKIAAMAMSTVMALSMGCMTAFALESNQTEVKATVLSSYTLVIPQSVTLVKESAGTGTYSKDFPVLVKGDIAEAATITVTEDGTTTLKNQLNTEKTATITNTGKTVWSGSEVREGMLEDGTGLTGTPKTWSASAILTPGTWSGPMTYKVVLSDSTAPVGETPLSYERSATPNV